MNIEEERLLEVAKRTEEEFLTTLFSILDEVYNKNKNEQQK